MPSSFSGKTTGKLLNFSFPWDMSGRCNSFPPRLNRRSPCKIYGCLAKRRLCSVSAWCLRTLHVPSGLSVVWWNQSNQEENSHPNGGAITTSSEVVSCARGTINPNHAQLLLVNHWLFIAVDSSPNTWNPVTAWVAVRLLQLRYAWKRVKCTETSPYSGATPKLVVSDCK